MRVLLLALGLPLAAAAQSPALDDTSWLRPVAHIWTRSAQPWVQLPADAVKFETQPPETWKVLFKLWRER